MLGAGRAGRCALYGEGVAGTGLAGRGAGGRAVPAGPAWETLRCVGHTCVHRRLFYDTEKKSHILFVSYGVFFTLYLDVLEQHRFDHLPSHQDPSGSPVQDVGARLQVHLKTQEMKQPANLKINK